MNAFGRENKKGREGNATNLQRSEKELPETNSYLETKRQKFIRQSKLAALGKLTAGVMHQISHPMNYVNTFSEIGLERLIASRKDLYRTLTTHPSVNELLDDLEEVLLNINECGHQSEDFIKQVLRLYNGEEGVRKPIYLNSLIQHFVHLSYHGMRAGTDAIDVNIKVNIDTSIDQLTLNPESISWIIINICDYAFEAMKAKVASTDETDSYEPILTVTTGRTDTCISIKIADNGPGIPPEATKKILQPFFTTKIGAEGTELGLSITNDIIKAQGGELKIVSKEGQGSNFIIELPLT